MARRCCGDSRTVGGVYVTCPLDSNGQPLEEFLVDPPIPVDLDALGISPIGMTMIERGGVTHLLDCVGESFYPNVCDFLEEVRRLGLSRKISRRTDFARLSPQSKIILIHRRAHIENADEYQRDRRRVVYHAQVPIDPSVQAMSRWCPKNIPEHEQGDFVGMCAGLWQEDLEGEPLIYHDGTPSGRYVKRALPCGEYRGWRKPDDVTPRYQYAIFAAFPVEQLDVIAGGSDETTDSYARASRSRVPVQIVEE